MRISLQKTLANKNSLRISSLLIGFLLWSILSSLHYNTLTIRVPLCFYDEHNNMINITDAPECITVTLKGSKAYLRSIDFNNLAVHIDANQLKKQHNGVIIDNKNLFLPKQVKLVHYSPINLMISKEQSYEKKENASSEVL